MILNFSSSFKKSIVHVVIRIQNYDQTRLLNINCLIYYCCILFIYSTKIRPMKALVASGVPGLEIELQSQISVAWLTMLTRWATCWAIEMWTFCHLLTLGTRFALSSFIHHVHGEGEWWPAYPGLVLDEDNTWFSGIAIHMSELQETHLSLEWKLKFLHSQSMTKLHVDQMLVDWDWVNMLGNWH